MANNKIIGGADETSRQEIASNSLSVANGDLLTLASGFVAKAVAASPMIIGVANGTKTYASDNQTVAKSKVNYLSVIPRETVLEIETSADVTQANVGKFYTLTAAQKVDAAT
jgi:regulator of RNase E activity RraA